ERLDDADVRKPAHGPAAQRESDPPRVEGVEPMLHHGRAYIITVPPDEPTRRTRLSLIAARLAGRRVDDGALDVEADRLRRWCQATSCDSRQASGFRPDDSGFIVHETAGQISRRRVRPRPGPPSSDQTQRTTFGPTPAPGSVRGTGRLPG